MWLVNSTIILKNKYQKNQNKSPKSKKREKKRKEKHILKTNRKQIKT
jgi:hypothetical protein